MAASYSNPFKGVLISANSGAGSQIARSGEKLGFYGADPATQQTHEVDVTTTAQAVTAINSIIGKLETLGLFASA